MLALCSDLALHRMNLGDRIVINRRNIFNNSLLCWATLKFLAADFIPPILLRYSYIDSKYSSPFSVQLARRVLKLVCTKSLKFEKTDASYFFFVFLYQGIKIFETKKWFVQISNNHENFWLVTVIEFFSKFFAAKLKSNIFLITCLPFYFYSVSEKWVRYPGPRFFPNWFQFFSININKKAKWRLHFLPYPKMFQILLE